MFLVYTCRLMLNRHNKGALFLGNDHLIGGAMFLVYTCRLMLNRHNKGELFLVNDHLTCVGGGLCVYKFVPSI